MKPSETLLTYLRELLIPAYIAAPECSELEDALDAEIARVADALGVTASEEIKAQLGAGPVGAGEVEDAFAALGGER